MDNVIRSKHLLKLATKFASLVNSNGTDLQASRYELLGDYISYRGGGITLL